LAVVGFFRPRHSRTIPPGSHITSRIVIAITIAIVIVITIAIAETLGSSDSATPSFGNHNQSSSVHSLMIVSLIIHLFDEGFHGHTIVAIGGEKGGGYLGSWTLMLGESERHGCERI